jgi:hypothetical protein
MAVVLGQQQNSKEIYNSRDSSNSSYSSVSSTPKVREVTVTLKRLRSSTELLQLSSTIIRHSSQQLVCDYCTGAQQSVTSVNRSDVLRLKLRLAHRVVLRCIAP